MLLRRSNRRAARYPTWTPELRWPSREGVDSRAGGDAHMHDEAAAGSLIAPYDFHKALGAPAAPRTSSTPAPTPGSGNAYHYHPETGHVHYGETAPSPEMRRPQINDHVVIAPRDNPSGERMHGRVNASIAGGIHVRYGNHETENLTGDQSHRGMMLAPASYHSHELPATALHAFNRNSSLGESEIEHSPEAPQWRQAMRQGPQVGQRFREVHHDIDQPHPYGPLREIANVSPNGRVLIRHADRDSALKEYGGIVEADPHTFSQALQHDALRPERPNSGAQKDNYLFTEMPQLFHGKVPEYGGSEYDDAPHRDVAQTLMGGDKVHHEGIRKMIYRHLDGKAGLADVAAAFSYRHGDLETRPREIRPNKHGGIDIHGEVRKHSPSGVESIVGTFHRGLDRDTKGNLVARHHYFELDHAHQGHGLATGFNEQAEKHYQDWGVKESHLHANLTVGGYAWARQGWDFKNAAHRKDMWTRFKSWADANGHTFPKRDFDRLSKKGTAWDMAEYDPAGERHPVRRADNHGNVQVDGHFPIGKAFLLGGNGWSGVKNLAAGSPHQQQAEKIRTERRGKILQKARPALKGPKEPGKLGGTYWINRHGRIRYGQGPQADPAPPPVAPGLDRPVSVPESKADTPHWARFGDYSPEATILHLRQLLLHGDEIVRVCGRFARYAAQVGDGTLTPREAARRACRFRDGGEFGRAVKSLRDFRKLADWDAKGTRAAGLDANDWPSVLKPTSPFVQGAVAAGFPGDAAAALAGICLRVAAWGHLEALDDDETHNEVAKRLLTRPDAEEGITKSLPLFLKATQGSVMRPGSRGGHIYWANGRLHYGNRPMPTPRSRGVATGETTPQWAAPGAFALKILHVGHRVLYRDATNARLWGKIISAFGEYLSVLPDNAEEYDLLHTVVVPVDRVMRVVPDGEGDEEAYRVEPRAPEDDLAKSLELEPWPALV